MRIVVLTTSYPRAENDYAGRFVADQVEQLRAQGHTVDVAKPGVYRDFGLCFGDGLFANIRRRPYAAPFLIVSMILTLRRLAKGADLVHAHWLAGGAIARFCGRPFVVTLHGSGSAGPFNDLALLGRFPSLVRVILGKARGVICVGQPLADAATAAGISNVSVIRNGTDIVVADRMPDEEPFVLFVGRLAPEKGITDLIAATHGLPLVVAGDGPLRELVPGALGLLPHDQVLDLYRRAACLVLTSYREGSPTVVVEAMAAGCPVVATDVADVPYLVADGETGFVVPVGDTKAIRQRLELLLSDPGLRERMGAAAQRRVRELCGWETVLPRLEQVYELATGA